MTTKIMNRPIHSSATSKQKKLRAAERCDREQWSSLVQGSQSISPLAARPSVLLVTLIVAFIIISTSSMFSFHHKSHQHQVEAGLIDIYRRYRPKLVPHEALNLSQSQLLSSTATALSSTTSGESDATTTSDDQRQAASTNSGGRPILSRSIEFSSPMERIMELIHQHPPVIVLSESTPEQPQQQQQQQQQANTAMSSSATGGQVVHQPMALEQASSSFGAGPLMTSTRQHWTLLDANQAALIQPMLSAQQQQLIQSTVPYDQQQQYYFTGNNQFSFLPAAGGFSPATSYQQIATLPYGPASDQSSPHQHSNFLQQSAQQYQQQMAAPQSGGGGGFEADRAQPVFLSSYVPEVTVQAVRPPPSAALLAVPQLAPAAAAAQLGVSPVAATRGPDSIQQVQYSQIMPSQQQQRPQAPSEDEQPARKGTDRSGGTAADSSEDENDKEPGGEEEPAGEEEAAAGKSKRSNSNSGGGEGPDEPNSGGNSAGSMSYEDKYDSDKDDEPAASNNNNHNSRGANHTSLDNGLINVGLNDDCLQCICRASSGCDHLLRCITRGSDEKYCGPFQLTEEYWNLAGSPGDAANNFLSFEDCANEADCAVETVTNYMKKYHKDCDGDENITCMDYARLHKLKPSECDNTDKLVNDYDAYWAKFQRCAEGYNRSRNGDDEDI